MGHFWIFFAPFALIVLTLAIAVRIGDAPPTIDGPDTASRWQRWGVLGTWAYNVLTAMILVSAVVALSANFRGVHEASRAADAANKQAAIAEDTERRQLRAYIVVTDFGVSCGDCGDTAIAAPPIPGIKNAIETRIENDGATPATEVNGITNWYSINGSGQNLPTDFLFADHPRTGFISKSDLGKDKHKDSAEELDTTGIAVFTAAVEKQTTLFLYGHIDYCDVFGTPHSTAFCFKYVPGAGTHLPICDRFNGEVPARQTCHR